MPRSCSPRTTWARSSGCATTSLLLQAGRIFERGSPRELIERFGREDMEQVFLDMARGRGRGLDALGRREAAQ